VTVLKRKAEYLCQELGILDKVIFLETVMKSILSYTDLFLLPSQTESFGLAIRGYGLGVPVISSNSGGLSEVNLREFRLPQRCWEYRRNG
jgi:glycosyltransferase involved in cell wall biosynthesis